MPKINAIDQSGETYDLSTIPVVDLGKAISGIGNISKVVSNQDTFDFSSVPKEQVGAAIKGMFPGAIPDIQLPSPISPAIASAYPVDKNKTFGEAVSQNPPSPTFIPIQKPAYSEKDVETGGERPTGGELIKDIATAGGKQVMSDAVSGAKLGAKLVGAPLSALSKLTGSEENMSASAIGERLGLDEAQKFWQLTPEEAKKLNAEGGTIPSQVVAMMGEMPAYVAAGGPIESMVGSVVKKYAPKAIAAAIPILSERAPKIADALSRYVSSVGTMASVQGGQVTGQEGLAGLKKEAPGILKGAAEMGVAGEFLPKGAKLKEAPEELKPAESPPASAEKPTVPTETPPEKPLPAPNQGESFREYTERIGVSKASPRYEEAIAKHDAGPTSTQKAPTQATAEESNAVTPVEPTPEEKQPTATSPERTGQETKTKAQEQPAGIPSEEKPVETNIDAVTGLQNSNTIRPKLQAAGADPTKDILFVDIDDFKAINDTYGHEEGDKVLKALGQSIRDHFPGAEYGRFGGEEFAVILPKNEHAQAEAFLKAVPSEVRVKDSPVTVSGGIGNDLKQADDNLYKSKQIGKNQISVDNSSKKPYNIQGTPVGEKDYVTATDLRQVGQRAARLLQSSKVRTPEDRSALEGAIQTVNRIARGDVQGEAGGAAEGVAKPEQPTSEAPTGTPANVESNAPAETVESTISEEDLKNTTEYRQEEFKSNLHAQLYDALKNGWTERVGNQKVFHPGSYKGWLDDYNLLTERKNFTGQTRYNKRGGRKTPSENANSFLQSVVDNYRTDPDGTRALEEMELNPPKNANDVRSWLEDSRHPTKNSGPTQSFKNWSADYLKEQREEAEGKAADADQEYEDYWKQQEEAYKKSQEEQTEKPSVTQTNILNEREKTPEQLQAEEDLKKAEEAKRAGDKGTEGLPIFEKEQQASEQTQLPLKPPPKEPPPVAPAPVVEPVPPPAPKGPLSKAADILKSEEGSVSLKPKSRRTNVDESDPDIKAVEDHFEKQDKDMRKKFAFNFKKAMKNVATGWVDRGGTITRVLERDPYGKEAAIDYYLAKGASSEAEALASEAVQDIEKELKGYDEQVKYNLAKYLENTRTIEVSKLKAEKGEGIKSPVEVKAAQKWIDSYKKLNPEESAAVEKAARVFWNTMKSQVKQLKDEGLIDNEAYQALLKHEHYYPRRFIQHIDEGWERSSDGRAISVPDSGIKSLEEGSTESMLNNPYLLLSQTIARTQGRIFKNRANKSLYKYATEVPNNELGITTRDVEVVPGDKSEQTDLLGFKKAPEFKKQDVPAGHTAISVMIDGKRKEMIMPTGIAKSWAITDPAINEAVAKTIHYLSGSFLVKPLATGINPYFAITNTPRDIAHIWMTTKEYNPTIPVAAFQLGKDILTVAKDAFGRGKRFRDYIREGGGMELMTNQGQNVKKPYQLEGNVLGKVLYNTTKMMGYFNETSELFTRLALRERAIKNGKTPKEATFIARNYMDFAQGGAQSKFWDKGIPYLNASIQGTRGLFRAMKNDPKVTTYKIAQLMTLAGALTYWNRAQHKEAWDSISDSEKENKFIFTTDISYPDKNGQTRYFYWSIPKEQSQRLITALAEAPVDYDNNPKSKLWQGLIDLIPNIPVSDLNQMPPTIKALIGYATNYDFWKNKSIWKGRTVDPHAEWRNDTPEAYKKLADKAKDVGIELSPARAKFAVDQVVPKNLFTDILGRTWDAATGGLEQKQKDMMNKTMAQKIAEFPFASRIFRQTMPEPEADEVETVKKAMREGMLKEGSKYQGKDLGDQKVLHEMKKEADTKELEIADIRQKNDNGLAKIIYENKKDPALRQKVQEYISKASKEIAGEEGVTGESNRLIKRAINLFKRANIKFDSEQGASK